ncbi:pyridoxamine 5'-phosphate oxidase family protein [Azoarcus sp. L1K30]|uniref:pyridoxamine 5'-phosphate oxidase family protein n=1 Tax=Azoarcus sp. L1K30 TaxID=2820277 RepID=UPI001B83A41C|nr:pyridoxamine 5'-phosphate oxidase family protein [Azoarcus sp. L1K30]MBR0567403.1 pyridoxamine 5'-phosphate oxidase family protein [Azoarcus sp. L1K30]
MNGHPAPSARTRVRRLPDRGHYDAGTIAAIVDAASVCTVAFQHEGAVHALPTIHWRDGEHLYIHGAKASRMLKALTAGDACVTLCMVDGLVYARSAFHHSMNYRSVVIYGRFEIIDDPDEKTRRLRPLIEKFATGRWDELRPMTLKELNATSVLRIPLSEASAKIRNAGVKDDDEDMQWPVWAGVVPIESKRGTPLTDPDSVVREIPYQQLK